MCVELHGRPYGTKLIVNGNLIGGIQRMVIDCQAGELPRISILGLKRKDGRLFMQEGDVARSHTTLSVDDLSIQLRKDGRNYIQISLPPQSLFDKFGRSDQNQKDPT